MTAMLAIKGYALGFSNIDLDDPFYCVSDDGFRDMKASLSTYIAYDLKTYNADDLARYDDAIQPLVDYCNYFNSGLISLIFLNQI